MSLANICKCAFCHERAVLGLFWTDISREDTLSQMIDQVLACAERQVLMDDLLQKSRRREPEAYERLKPYEEQVLRTAHQQATGAEAAE